MERRLVTPICRYFGKLNGNFSPVHSHCKHKTILQRQAKSASLCNVNNHVFHFHTTSTIRATSTTNWHQQQQHKKQQHTQTSEAPSRQLDFAESEPGKQPKYGLDFDKTDVALEQKTTGELLRAWVVLSLSSFGFIVENSEKVVF